MYVNLSRSGGRRGKGMGRRERRKQSQGEFFSAGGQWQEGMVRRRRVRQGLEIRARNPSRPFLSLSLSPRKVGWSQIAVLRRSSSNPPSRFVSSRRVASRGPHLWFWHSTLACATRVRASDVSPLVAQPKWSSISMIFSTLDGTSKVDVSRFSTARTTPSLVLIPIAVVPSCVARTNAREKKGDGRRSVQVQQKRVRSSSAVSLTGRPEPWRSSLP